MKKFKIKKGDKVTIVAGDDKGKTAEVLKVLTKQDAVIVQDAKQLKKQLSQLKRIKMVVLHPKRCRSISLM